ncbi:GNAT family N-acetyltransferase [Nodosilinea sp. LEGE 06152]|uniref:GNAT family N-acetyltransferase n=1 Tax=Nodosilinea sp. LEGE 06152 TaxID=2777966 RepID=UPI0018816BA8|nr:GNAT family N-acetyltransferase [Nodosilinea sp. LEGE 06152]MBE9156154.1 GNAT family N-acetyltransferase [Nodosilinea sp. LEGE 06152]
METLSSLTVLHPTQFDAATELLCAAFADDPLFNYLVPTDVSDRPQVMTYIFRMLLLCGGDHGYCLADTDSQTLKGIAIWLPPGQSVGLVDMLRAGLYELPFCLPWHYLSRWQAALALDHYHQQAMPMPHWYLMLLAVGPRYQRQGVGHQLMQPGLEGSDTGGQPCYVETSTADAVRFYRRHGFDIVKTGPFAEQAPAFWTLQRLGRVA